MIHEMVHSILRYLGGIQQYGVFSMCLFGSVFVAVFISACLQKKSHVDYMSRIALDSDPEASQPAEHSHE